MDEGVLNCAKMTFDSWVEGVSWLIKSYEEPEPVPFELYEYQRVLLEQEQHRKRFVPAAQDIVSRWWQKECR